MQSEKGNFPQKQRNITVFSHKGAILVCSKQVKSIQEGKKSEDARLIASRQRSFFD